MSNREEAIDILTKMSTNHFYGHREQEAFKLAVEALSAPRWIPCSERLPEFNQKVLICTDDGLNMIAFLYPGEDGWPDEWYYFYEAYDHDIWDEHEQGKIIAWMPLPEPWEGENDG